MVLYLLKSTACLAIFIAFYKAFLEQESINVFKRFYLLAIILVSFGIPAIVFTEYVEIPEPITQNIPYSTPSIVQEPVTAVAQAKEIDWSQIVWVIYGLGVLVFGVKFSKNLFNIYQRIRKNQKIKTDSNIKVLLEKSIVPHTFFRYIFLNKKKYLNGEIPSPVLHHEETHARQKHSIDVLFMELLQTFFWFNPLLYILKHAIKLNHEFLADRAVLKEGTHPSDYQKTILKYSSIHQPPLANAINYSSIKKRFTVMKKQTSKKGIILRSTLVLPLLAMLLFAFSETKVEPKIIENPSKVIKIDIKDENEIWFKDENTTLEKLADKLSSSFVDNTKVEIYEAQIYSNELVTSAFLNQITKEIRKTGVKRITVFSDRYSLPESEYQDAIEITPETVILKTNQVIVPSTNINRYNRLSKKYNAIPIEKRIIPIEDLRILETLYQEMSEEQKQYAQPFPECLPKNQQDGVSSEELENYNALATKYNTMDPDDMYIKKRDVDILKKIYGLMSPKQKANAEPFPDFPELPPVPEEPVAPKTVSKVPYASNQIDSIIEVQDPYDVVGGSISIKQPNQPVAPTYLKNIEPISPSPPPTPQSPLDFAIEMAKKGAIFKYEGQHISSDKAIDLLKKNNSIHMKVKNSNGKTPIIHLSKEPITIGATKTSQNKNNLLEYAIELKENNALFYYNDKPINAEDGIALIEAKHYTSVDTNPWTSKRAEVKIYNQNTNSQKKTSNSSSKPAKRTIKIGGLALDSETLEPLADVSLFGSKGELLTKTDKNGYFKFKLNYVKEGELYFQFSLKKDNYKSAVQKEHWGNLSGTITSAFYIGLQKKGSNFEPFSDLFSNTSDLSYPAISDNFTHVKKRFSFEQKIKKAKLANEDVFFKIDNANYIVNNTGWIKLNSEQDLIAINNSKIIPAAKLNGQLRRSSITGMSPIDNSQAQFAISTH